VTELVGKLPNVPGYIPFLAADPKPDSDDQPRIRAQVGIKMDSRRQSGRPSAEGFRVGAHRGEEIPGRRRRGRHRACRASRTWNIELNRSRGALRFARAGVLDVVQSGLGGEKCHHRSLPAANGFPDPGAIGRRMNATTSSGSAGRAGVHFPPENSFNWGQGREPFHATSGRTK